MMELGMIGKGSLWGVYLTPKTFSSHNFSSINTVAYFFIHFQPPYLFYTLTHFFALYSYTREREMRKNLKSKKGSYFSATSRYARTHANSRLQSRSTVADDAERISNSV